MTTKKSSSYKVEIINWNGDNGNREEFSEVITELLIPVIKKNVNIYVPHNEEREPIEGEDFSIFI